VLHKPWHWQFNEKLLPDAFFVRKAEGYRWRKAATPKSEAQRCAAPDHHTPCIVVSLTAILPHTLQVLLKIEVIVKEEN